MPPSDPAITELGAAPPGPAESDAAPAESDRPTTVAPVPVKRVGGRAVLVWGYVAVGVGFAGTVTPTLVKSVFWGRVWVIAAMAVMITGMGLILFGLVRNTVREL
ncbi:MAG TPA: hypothetical protein VK986_04160 [Tepidisphaeraceae bacterium]|nr:hypothetical protein [Tepidisphaeraceae bacterium]